jgi:hypothetical protein
MHLVGVIVLIAISWFAFDFIVPYPQIEQLCTDIFLIGRTCIPDPVSVATLPQRIFEWWLQKLVTIVVIALVGSFAVFMLGGKKF